jgi:Right handed beta helix region
MDSSGGGGGGGFITIDNILPDYTYCIRKNTSTNLYEARDSIDGCLITSTNASLAIVVQAVVNLLPVSKSYAKILIGPGKHVWSSSVVRIDGISDVTIEGASRETTILEMTSTYPNDSCIRFEGIRGTSYPLTANCNIKTNIATVSTSDVTNFAVGDWVLIYSTENVDTDFSTRVMGEITTVFTVNNSTGAITLGDYTGANYTTALTSKIAKITPCKNISVKNLTITSSNPADSYMASGSINMKYGINCLVDNCIIHDVYDVGIGFGSMVSSVISNCAIWNIKDDPSTNTRYGMTCGGASRDCVIIGNRGLGGYRHFVQSVQGTGETRNLLVIGNSSGDALYADFGTHQGGSGYHFIGNTVHGSKTAPGFDQGAFELRSPNSTIENNVIFHSAGRPIHVTQSATGAIVSNNQLIGSRRDQDNVNRTAIVIEAPYCVVSNNQVTDSDSDGISTTSTAPYCVIENNVIRNWKVWTSSPSAYAIKAGAADIKIKNNSCIGITGNQCINTNGNSRLDIFDNDLRGGSGPIKGTITSDTRIRDNRGYDY